MDYFQSYTILDAKAQATKTLSTEATNKFWGWQRMNENQEAGRRKR